MFDCCSIRWWWRWCWCWGCAFAAVVMLFCLLLQLSGKPYKRLYKNKNYNRMETSISQRPWWIKSHFGKWKTTNLQLIFPLILQPFFHPLLNTNTPATCETTKIWLFFQKLGPIINHHNPFIQGLIIYGPIAERHPVDSQSSSLPSPRVASRNLPPHEPTKRWPNAKV